MLLNFLQSQNHEEIRYYQTFSGDSLGQVEVVEFDDVVKLRQNFI